MPAINQEVFVNTITDPFHPNHPNLVFNVREAGFYYPQYDIPVPINPVDREAALLLLDQIKAMVGQRGYYAGKWLRPYAFDSFEYLNRSEPWWGFEFETGYASVEARKQATDMAFDLGINGVTFDQEGEGPHFSEITFSPAEQSTFLDGTAPAFKFIQWLNDNKELTNNTGYEMIGTHLNLSLPDMSETDYVQASYVLNNSIHLLPLLNDEKESIRKLMFGRNDIYGGCHCPDGGWIEMKLFRTTYDVEEFRRYVRTAQALTKIVMETKKLGLGRPNQAGVTNLYDMWKDPSVEPEFVINQFGLRGEYEGWWLNSPDAEENDRYDYDDDDYYEDGDEY